MNRSSVTNHVYPMGGALPKVTRRKKEPSNLDMCGLIIGTVRAELWGAPSNFNVLVPSLIYWQNEGRGPARLLKAKLVLGKVPGQAGAAAEVA
jgi:hypothetical protein